MTKITKVSALPILDSRGNWTIEANLELEGRFLGVAGVPAGASLSLYEKKTVPVKTAVTAINNLIRPRLLGRDLPNQAEFDNFLINFDADPQGSSLGANTTLSLSLAFARAKASQENSPLYRYFATIFDNADPLFLPHPIFNLINGGRHAENDLDFQEFHIIPRRGKSFEDNLERGHLFYQGLGHLLEANGFEKDLGDEGGFAPRNISHERALNFILEAGKKNNFEPGKDFSLGLDVAATTLILGEIYEFKREGFKMTSNELLDFYLNLLTAFPLSYLEDPFGQDSFLEFKKITQKVGKKVEIVGDDLIATSPERLAHAIKDKSVTAVIIKPNQIGTLTETLAVAREALKNKICLVVSHRSGETEDTTIADLAVGLGAKYIKAGPPARGERVAKYNRLLEIEKELSEKN